MKYINIKYTDLNVSEIAQGCMRLTERTEKEINELISYDLDRGINFFDHADIYGGGKCEELFGDVLKCSPSLREKMIIQSKCGIRKGNHPTYFDFSKDYIISSVEGSLKRLKTDYLDILLLHRPDTLFEPEEVGEAFRALEEAGKVRYFGVSNQNPTQIELLQKFLPQKIVANQLQLSICHAPMIKSGLNVNMENDSGIMHDGGILEYCRLKDITIQPWSPFQFGFFQGVFIDNDKFPQLQKELENISKKYKITKEAVAIAWLLRHPAKMQPILGTTNLKRIEGIIKASDITLSKEEWYRIFISAGNILP